MTDFEVNGRSYRTPGAPVVVVCVDGSEPAYHEQALARGRMPWLARTLEAYAGSWPARCAMPALTNPNNVSIATGGPASLHGISGNHFLDPETGRAVMMDDPRFLRAPTLFAAAEQAGLDVAVVTAKDKLRRLLGAGLVRGTCWSAERADEATLALVGRERPDVYSADLSEFVLAAGVRLLEHRRPDLTYLSLSDYVQHKHAPASPVADDFYAVLDTYAAQLDALGAVVVLTADHGMSAKSDSTGRPRVLHVEDEVRRLLGPGDHAGLVVVLPITDPYTAHHGALGSFASVHLPAGIDRASVETVVTGLRALPGVDRVHERDEAAELLALPADRIGDVVVLAEAGTALGRTPATHDLSALDAPLRSHGGLGEADVPFLINRRLESPERLALPDPLHNYDAFWVATTVVARTVEPAR